MKGFRNIQPQKQLEIQPFLVNQFDSYPAQNGNPFRDGQDYILNEGLDADPGVIALGGFQIFLKREDLSLLRIKTFLSMNLQLEMTIFSIVEE
ncbi:hypothetical protein LCGC14_0050710 [marine sediment metagenome]|uniref:Uncharacterized protein n=1 Tax=marine sediment metagenome TaxID=412755 RepID=A0A0F9Y701_9ZZZZ|nr:hypothetical protein [Maribacter sp.]HDZ06881.1 hypothetical protein [Maribacter sp.]HEA81538.1 hypothetical protein [Maribacter sp.]